MSPGMTSPWLRPRPVARTMEPTPAEGDSEPTGVPGRRPRSIPREEGAMAAADEPASFGELVRQHRLDAGLTQAALAERAGISLRAVQDLERSVGRPQRETARRLAEAL